MKTHILPTKAVTLSLFMVLTMAGLVLFGLSGSMSAPNSATARPTAPSQSAPRSTAQVREAYGQIPLSFEANRGQADETNEVYGRLALSFEANRGQTADSVDFLARGPGYTLFLQAGEIVFRLKHGTESRVLRMKVRDASALATGQGIEELPGRAHYFLGADPDKWRCEIPTFGRVGYRGIYPGIDLVYYGNHRQLEYDFVVAPGADWRQISLEFEGAEGIELERSTGDLLLRLDDATIRQPKPIVYQEVDGRRDVVEGQYLLQENGVIRFEVGEYDNRRPLVIDPVLVYSTYLGGNGDDQATGIAVDSGGNAYITGYTTSTNFPSVNPSQGINTGGGDAFVTKINSQGTAIVYSTYLGGNSFDSGAGIVVDSQRNAYIAGTTTSANFPVANAIQGTFGGGGSDTFVAKLNPTGAALIYSTFLGGSKSDTAFGIALDPSVNVYVTGRTDSTNFPTANAIQNAYGGAPSDAFVTKINAAGSAYVYSTYLGGPPGSAVNELEHGRAIAADSAGNAYVTGKTGSNNFPRMNALQNTLRGDSDAFVTKLNAAGSAFVYSTYLGGSSFDEGLGITANSAGDAYLTGSTNSISDFPTANPIKAQKDPGGTNDAFVTRINPGGSALVYSTYLGGTKSDVGNGIALDAAGNAYIAGWTLSTDFPVADAVQPSKADGAGSDAFITKINAAGSGFIYSTYLGGPEPADFRAQDQSFGIAVDAEENAYVVGFTWSASFPVVNPIQNAHGGGAFDSFVTKIGVPSTRKAATTGNIATRMRVLTGDSALIGGFIITGSDPKRVIIRGIGPSLSAFGVQGALANPALDLFDSNQTLLGSNDDWKSNQAEVEATTIPPSHDLESAIVKTLTPGAYTAVLRGQNNSTGIGVVEVYDLNAAANAILANISSRGFVDSGDNVMIGGFIVGGNGQADARVVIRGIGPSLDAFGITGALEDPIVDLKDVNGTTLLSNDDWQQGQPAQITQLGLAPGDSRECALLTSLPHGNFTAILRGKNNTTGVAVVEVYNVP